MVKSNLKFQTIVQKLKKNITIWHLFKIIITNISNYDGSNCFINQFFFLNRVKFNKIQKKYYISK